MSKQGDGGQTSGIADGAVSVARVPFRFAYLDCLLPSPPFTFYLLLRTYMVCGASDCGFFFSLFSLFSLSCLDLTFVVYFLRDWAVGLVPAR